MIAFGAVFLGALMLTVLLARREIWRLYLRRKGVPYAQDDWAATIEIFGIFFCLVGLVAGLALLARGPILYAIVLLSLAAAIGVGILARNAPDA
jgi:hypothetical protein